MLSYESAVIQCFNCLRCGHSKKLCRHKILCPKCANDHELRACPSNSLPICIFCNGANLSNKQTTPLRNRSCSELLRQKHICRLMTFHNVSYFETAQAVPLIMNLDGTNQFNPFSISRNFHPLPTQSNVDGVLRINPIPYSFQNQKRFTQELQKPVRSLLIGKRNYSE